MEENKLEFRMYFFVVSSLKGISQGIMCGHTALEYALKYGQTKEFIDFATNWKTWIILNGGTTNEQRDFDGIAEGTLNQIGDQLLENEILFSYFKEPDLNNALTALCFIADERVFNKKDYPDFIEYLIERIPMESSRASVELVLLKTMKNDAIIKKYPEYYKEWIQLIGGIKNVFLRELLKDKILA